MPYFFLSGTGSSNFTFIFNCFWIIKGNVVCKGLPFLPKNKQIFSSLVDVYLALLIFWSAARALAARFFQTTVPLCPFFSFLPSIEVKLFQQFCKRLGFITLLTYLVNFLCLKIIFFRSFRISSGTVHAYLHRYHRRENHEHQYRILAPLCGKEKNLILFSVECNNAQQRCCDNR